MHVDTARALAHSIRTGDPGAPLVLCVHGQGGQVDDWTDRARRIATHGLEVLVAEIPLHGARRVADMDPSGTLEMLDYLRLVDVAANELNEIVDSVGNGRAVGLLGHSLGAEIALVATSRNQNIAAVVAVGTVVSDPDWAGPGSQWHGGDTVQFAAALARITLLDRPQLLAARDITYLHGVDDSDAPLTELLRLLDACGQRDRLTSIRGGHDLTNAAIDLAATLAARSLAAKNEALSGEGSMASPS